MDKATSLAESIYARHSGELKIRGRGVGMTEEARSSATGGAMEAGRKL
jgi:hypothetical protein